ncbi:hypothetical protein [Luteirhabdus pelagi]|uniref:hypothetical protein n=1 Tax=Luteirhabdus pelagi TaxID=2792783 RepID=UPI00193AAAD6|nr:hypothetical protein [Luteirhabdus pelagi]
MKYLIILTISFLTCSVSAQRNPFKNLSERDGKIGIGTERPDELLTVKGKIHTQEVLVDLDGAVAPDYVFHTYFGESDTEFLNYRMLTLGELKAYIEKYYHLPKVPSAETMKKEGMSLKEMNLLLLEKVEELTLYTLEQQEQIEALQEKLSKLEE